MKSLSEWVTVVRTVAALSIAGSAVACTPEETRPNIVFIYIDDLGWRDVAFMGSSYYETPHVDGLAAQGMVFTNAYANAPNCAPSRASLLTGQYTPRHGIYTVNSAARGDARLRRIIPTENTTVLALEAVTLAEALRDAGYATGHIGKWHLGGDGYLPTDQGFDINVAGREYGSPPDYFYPYTNRTNRLGDLQAGGADGEYLTDRLTDEALHFLEEHAHQPFFLYLSHYAVHTPLRAKEEIVEHYRAKAGSGGHDNPVYAAMITSVDEGVGRILAKLDELDLTANTVVVFYSDNGGFGPATSMAPLRGSKGMLYEGGIREPLVVRWPGHVAPGSSSDTPVIGTDFFPTLLAVAGVAPPSGHTLDGLSLLPVLTGMGDLPGRPLFWHFPAYLEADRSVEGPWRTTPAGAVRLGDFKLIEFFEDGQLELYDLARDVGEERNLANEMPQKTRELHDLLVAWRERLNAPVPKEPNPEYDPTMANARR